MPRRKRRAGRAASAFRQVQNQARALLGTLRKEIRIAEAELHRLKGEQSRLGALVGSALGAGPRAGGGGRSRGGRVNWRTVLDQLPKQFKASHVRGVRGLKGKRPSEIFAAITRWIDSGLAKRKARGVNTKA
jgi:hypothetical protein